MMMKIIITMIIYTINRINVIFNINCDDNSNNEYQ